jgi:hypothetical protein
MGSWQDGHLGVDDVAVEHGRQLGRVVEQGVQVRQLGKGVVGRRKDREWTVCQGTML